MVYILAVSRKPLKAENLVCPYSSCGQEFQQPVMVTDSSKLPRETYYACPHCMLRLQLRLDGNSDEGESGTVHVQAMEETVLTHIQSPRKGVFAEAVSSPYATRPSKSCRHFFGYLRGLPHGIDLPDECAVCSNIVQCYSKDP
jgi:DNA-directed RNA polymerase subunit RPC12/RpoP